MIKQAHQVGMTLIELMVSIAIMAIIATGAYQVLSNLQASHDRLEIKTQQIDALQRFWYLLSQDAQFATDRFIRVNNDERFGVESDDNFEKRPEAFAGQVGLVQFSRRAGLPRLNDGIAQSELRRVAYATESDILYRFQWTQMDSIEGEVPVGQVMLEGVQSLTFRYGFASGGPTLTGVTAGSAASGNNQTPTTWTWFTQWPAPNPNSQTGVQATGAQNPATQNLLSQTTVPNLLEVSLELEGVGSMTRLFQLGAPDAAQWQIMKATSSQNQNQNQDQNQSSNSEEI